MIGQRRGTLIVAVLTDEGLLVAADRRYSLLSPGAGAEERSKIRLVASPPRTVLCVAGVDRIVRVPGVARAGWNPGPADVLLDFAEIAASRLPEAAEALTEDWLAATALESARRLASDPRIRGAPAPASPDRPFSELILATAEEGGDRARLAVAGLTTGPPWTGMARVSAEILELARVGEFRFFGDLPFLERDLPEDRARCAAVLSAARLPAAAALCAITALVETAERVPGSTIGGPTDAVLIASAVTALRMGERE